MWPRVIDENTIRTGRLEWDGKIEEGMIVKSHEDLRAASRLIGMDQDTSKPDTYGLINGHLVVIDYGFILPPASH